MEASLRVGSFLLLLTIRLSSIRSLSIRTETLNDANDWFDMKLINYTAYQQVLINRQLFVMRGVNVSYESRVSAHDFLVATRVNNSWISATESGPWKNPLKQVKGQLAKIEERDRFTVLAQAYSNPIQLEDFKVKMNILMPTQFLFINSYVEFDGFLSLNQLALATSLSPSNENSHQNAIIHRDGTITINENYSEINHSAQKNEEDNPSSSIIQFIKCDMIPSIYWSCNGSYLFFGEEYDIYLIRQLNKTIVFDSLSHYSLIPFEEWNYFKREYFGKNEDCTNVLIESSQPRMYYIQCSKLKTYQSDKRKIINFIFANHSIQYGNVFEEVLYLSNSTAPYLNSTNETQVYFNFLFCEQLSHWVLGVNFFKNRTIGFDYKSKQMLIEFDPEKSFDFSKYFISQQQSDFKLWLFIGTSVVAVIIFVVSGILNWRSRRQLDKQFNEITQMELKQQGAQSALIEEKKDSVVNDSKYKDIEGSAVKENAIEEEDIIEEIPIDEEISIASRIIR